MINYNAGNGNNVRDNGGAKLNPSAQNPKSTGSFSKALLAVRADVAKKSESKDYKQPKTHIDIFRANSQ